MKLQQLRYALEVYRHNLNVSEAADALFTSQPGVSKQIRLLEEELGIQIFIRSGKRIVSVSQPGKDVLQIVERVLHDIQNIKNIGKVLPNVKICAIFSIFSNFFVILNLVLLFVRMKVTLNRVGNELPTLRLLYAVNTIFSNFFQ